MRKAATSPGIAGNDLNRCDAPALQHKIRANIKRTAAVFANSRLRVVGMGSGGQKRIALDSNKERFVQKKGFWFVKAGNFQVQLKSFRQKITFWFAKKLMFSVHAKQTEKEKLFSTYKKFKFLPHQS